MIKKIIRAIYLFFLKLFPERKRDPGRLVKQEGIYKDTTDDRDYIYVGEIPERPIKYQIIDNPRDFVKHQGMWGSCASHAMATAMEISHQINDQIPTELSERFHYYFARVENGFYPENKGMTSRTMLRIAQHTGICPEKLCPYICAEMNDPPGAFTESFARFWKIKHYFRVTTIDDAKDALLKDQPICVGFYMNRSFANNRGEITADEVALYGGHEVVIYGYDDDKQVFLCINSWGKNYKNSGLMEVPYEYYKKYGIDMWTFDIQKSGDKW